MNNVPGGVVLRMSALETAETPDRDDEQHDDEQDRAVQQWRGNGLATRDLRAQSGGRRPAGIDGAWIKTAAMVDLSRCRLHRLSVSTAGACSWGLSLSKIALRQARRKGHARDAHNDGLTAQRTCLRRKAHGALGMVGRVQGLLGLLT